MSAIRSVRVRVSPVTPGDPPKVGMMVGHMRVDRFTDPACVVRLNGDTMFLTFHPSRVTIARKPRRAAP